MEIGDMLYKNISEIVGKRGISVGFEFKNDKVIMKVEKIVDEEKDVYDGIKSI